MGEPLNFELTFDQWKADVLHRIWCRQGGCDDYAHTYVAAIDEGRVFVDGQPAEVIYNQIDDDAFEQLLGDIIQATDLLRGVPMPTLTAQQMRDLADS